MLKIHSLTSITWSINFIVIIFVDQKKISIEFCSSSDKTEPDVSTTNVTDNSTTNVSRVNNFVRQVRNKLLLQKFEWYFIFI